MMEEPAALGSIYPSTIHCISPRSQHQLHFNVKKLRKNLVHTMTHGAF